MTHVKEKLVDALDATLEELYTVYANWDMNNAYAQLCKTKLTFAKDYPEFDLEANEEGDLVDEMRDNERDAETCGNLASVLEPIAQYLRKALKEAELYEEFLK